MISLYLQANELSSLSFQASSIHPSIYQSALMTEASQTQREDGGLELSSGKNQISFNSRRREMKKLLTITALDPIPGLLGAASTRAHKRTNGMAAGERETVRANDGVSSEISAVCAQKMGKCTPVWTLSNAFTGAKLHSQWVCMCTQQPG